MASFKVTGKTSDGKQIGGVVHGESIAAAVGALNSHIVSQGKTIKQLTIKPMEVDTGIKISEPRVRKTTATPSADGATPAADGATAAPVAVETVSAPAPAAQAAPVAATRPSRNRR